MNLIELDKKAVLLVQKWLGLSNYGMVNLSWVFGFAVGVYRLAYSLLVLLILLIMRRLPSNELA